MTAERFFHPLSPSIPVLYGYKGAKGELFIGYTTGDVYTHFTASINGRAELYRMAFLRKAMKADGTVVTDDAVYKALQSKGYCKDSKGFYTISESSLTHIIDELFVDRHIIGQSNSFKMRPEQEEAVSITMNYFLKAKQEDPDRTPHFLWNCKMRFGKTFAAYQLARQMAWKRILVLTFKPAVEAMWEEDLLSHVDFIGWHFVRCKETTAEPTFTSNIPLVCFGSFQDLMGKNINGGIKSKNEWIHSTNWDCVIFDEYHFGAWRDGAKDLFENELGDISGAIEYFDENLMPITTNHYLYLSGTPFRAILTGEFIENQIYNWTYSDEQRAKTTWDYRKGRNLYSSLPRVVMLTYRLPEEIRTISEDEFNYFDLNEFFATAGSGTSASFVHKEFVQNWLDFISGKYKGGIYNDQTAFNGLKTAAPFSNENLRQTLKHTFWFLPKVDSCHAMRNLLREPQNKFFDDYEVIVAAGTQAGIGVEAIGPVLSAMSKPDPLSCNSITLSCGKLTTGVTIRPWTGIFILRNLNSPETYFQAAFRVQSPWTIKNEKQLDQTEILKTECYVFDFSPNRALRQIADYSCQLSLDEDNPESKVQEFIRYMPVLAYEDGKVFQMHGGAILDVSMSGTTASLLARRWESVRLVNVDDDTLRRLLNCHEALDALLKIEGFRNLNSDIEDIINKGEAIRNKKMNDSKKRSKQDTEEEKEYKSLRKELQEKLIRFAARIPIFLYLTDYREKSLKDIILKIEPGLFKKVTGLDIHSFDLLLSIGVFNSQLMNDAIYKFKQYEDSSLDYSGICKHQENQIGGFDTVISKEEYLMS